eukprot:6203076-Pleurochrysis_carterae.AAC.1
MKLPRECAAAGLALPFRMDDSSQHSDCTALCTQVTARQTASIRQRRPKAQCKSAAEALFYTCSASPSNARLLIASVHRSNSMHM